MIGLVVWVGCLLSLIVGVLTGHEEGRKAAARGCTVAGVFVVDDKAYDCTPRQKGQK
jgi:hypothetical protein